ncbi:MAG: hypothetical protein ACYTFI_21735 [Planctomycetota bacterium]|jgi:hypothetical protein
MSADVITHLPLHAERGVALYHPLLRAAILGLIIGALVFALVKSTYGLVRAEPAGEPVIAEHVLEFPSRELPPEWRWKPKPVAVEHMYAQKESPRLDWIRRPGSRSRSGR